MSSLLKIPQLMNLELRESYLFTSYVWTRESFSLPCQLIKVLLSEPLFSLAQLKFEHLDPAYMVWQRDANALIKPAPDCWVEGVRQIGGSQNQPFFIIVTATPCINCNSELSWPSELRTHIQYFDAPQAVLFCNHCSNFILLFLFYFCNLCSTATVLSI